MSLDFDIAPYCKGENCTTLLTARTDYDRGYCMICYDEKTTSKALKEKQDAIFEELKRLGVR